MSSPGPLRYLETDDEWITASERDPNLSPKVFYKGQRLYRSNCNTCHALKNPSDYTADRWRTVLPIMVGNVNKNDDILSSRDQEMMLDYVLSLSKQPAQSP